MTTSIAESTSTDRLFDENGVLINPAFSAEVQDEQRNAFAQGLEAGRREFLIEAAGREGGSMTLISERPVTVDRFRCDGLTFETHDDMRLNLKSFPGTFEHGAVLVRLNVDGWLRGEVTVADKPDSLFQLDLAIEVLVKTRDVLKRMRA